MVVFDATMLSLLLRSGAKPPLDSATGKPVQYAEVRIAHLVEQLEKSRTIVIIPTPALTEILIKAGAVGPTIVSRIQKSSVLRIQAFDSRAALELAQMTNALASVSDKRAAIDAPWSKIKFDRQIVAIAKVNAATAIYTDDEKLIAFAKLHDIPCIQTADLPIPDSARQPELPLSPTPLDDEHGPKDQD
jgi:hypothetical protein